MQKGAKQAQSKKGRPRKYIEIKQSKQISPVKEVLEPEESKFVMRTQKHQKIQIPAIKKSQFVFSNEEIQSLNSHADGLVSVQLMSRIIKKQEEMLNDLYSSCPSIVRKAFEKTLRTVEDSFKTIRQERIQRMKEDTIIFVAPDQDHFEKHKGKVLNNWIKQYIQVHEQKQNFDTDVDQYLDVFKSAEERIKKLAIDVPKDRVQPELQEIAMNVKQRNRVEIQNKMNEIRTELIDILVTTDQMRRIREQILEERQKVAKEKQIELERNVLKGIPTHTMALFNPEDYFV